MFLVVAQSKYDGRVETPQDRIVSLLLFKPDVSCYRTRRSQLNSTAPHYGPFRLLTIILFFNANTQSLFLRLI